MGLQQFKTQHTSQISPKGLLAHDQLNMPKLIREPNHESRQRAQQQTQRPSSSGEPSNTGPRSRRGSGPPTGQTGSDPSPPGPTTLTESENEWTHC
ncbi:hypothetical protein LIER_43092 [Lithospermum erythrorhizon]|uniref:Uncharacterized protein n=1 Tax=Lithospermum erythrorhizon TaxID=34254 RepID=A0AAV3PIZ4_LITER